MSANDDSIHPYRSRESLAKWVASLPTGSDYHASDVETIDEHLARLDISEQAAHRNKHITNSRDGSLSDGERPTPLLASPLLSNDMYANDHEGPHDFQLMSGYHDMSINDPAQGYGLTSSPFQPFSGHNREYDSIFRDPCSRGPPVTHMEPSFHNAPIANHHSAPLHIAPEGPSVSTEAALLGNWNFMGFPRPVSVSDENLLDIHQRFVPVWIHEFDTFSSGALNTVANVMLVWLSRPRYLPEYGRWPLHVNQSIHVPGPSFPHGYISNYSSVYLSEYGNIRNRRPHFHSRGSHQHELDLARQLTPPPLFPGCRPSFARN